MLVRVLHFILGAALAGGGGWLAWTHRATFGALMPPGEAGLPLSLLAGILGVTSGIVFLVSAVHPRPNQKRLRAEKAAREDAALQQAEAYYSQHTRPADRDWRSSNVAPLPPPAPAPAAPEPVTPRTVSVEPVAAAAASSAPQVFPATATLSPIPRAQEAPPAAARPVQPSAPVTPAASQSFGEIRSALAAGKLDEAEKMLNAARDSATGLALAELTALAGNHAQAAGQATHAKWLWRVALKRFAEQDAAETPAAKAVAESLRSAG